jgi:tyrosyl-tRNA synthetase
MIAEHHKDPGKRVLQKSLAKELTTLVHSEEDYKASVEASSILFNGTIHDISKLDDELFSDIFEGVPQFAISKADLEPGTSIIDLLSDKTKIFPSKGEARKMIQGGGIRINKEKIESQEFLVTQAHLINNKYILLQKGKNNYYLCSVN